MDAKSRFLEIKNRRNRQSGQSVVEFAFLVPVIIGMFFLLIQVENAITTAIVNNKYARAQLHFLFFNHRVYPETRFQELQDGQFKGDIAGRFWVGIDDKTNFGGGQPNPQAPERKIGRLAGSEEPKEEAPARGRQKVRIRVFAFTCLPPIGTKIGFNFTEGNLGEDTFANGSFKYCSP